MRQARDYLAIGLAKISAEGPKWDRRENYYRGKQDLPFAPEGVNLEYLSLREQSIANWLQLAMDAPIQRLRVDGFRTGRKGLADEAAWSDVWQANRLDARQRIVYNQMMVHGRGVMSVWPNKANRAQPIVRPENCKRVYIEKNPEDPFSSLWTVKTFSVNDRRLGSAGIYDVSKVKSVAVVFDAVSWVRFERGGALMIGDWVAVDSGVNPLGENPFVAYDFKLDADAETHNAMDQLIPAQDAINTIRFNTLLAMQFSAYRQRVFVGYDPVVRDAQGNVLYQTNADGTDRLDSNGQKMPMITSPGRIGVDRALIFPGAETKVFDLAESNLKNYIEVLGEFLTQLFAVGQIPPQYLLSRMANLSGDALAGAESTLASLVRDLQTNTGESHEQVMRLSNRARGVDQVDVASEVIWADGEARSFAQIVDAITKLIATGFPHESAYEMIPGATPQKVKVWMDQMDGAANNDPILNAARALQGSTPPVNAPASGF